MGRTRNVADQMADILDVVSKNCKGALETGSMSVAKETVQKLRNTSPKKTGDYAKGWKVSKKKIKGSSVLVVHNATDYQLTHLLENGHVIKNAKGEYGRTRPIKHIEPVADWAEDELPRKVLEDLDL